MPPARFRQDQVRAPLRLALAAPPAPAEDDPMTLDVASGGEQGEDGAATADLDVVGVGAETQDAQWAAVAGGEVEWYGGWRRGAGARGGRPRRCPPLDPPASPAAFPRAVNSARGC